MTQLSIGRPRFLTTPEILTLQETSINQFGGAHGLRDSGLLDSALAQPKQAFGGDFNHTYPFEMAAAYAFHLCNNHPFVDGNKRVAFFAAVTFLRMNGWNLEASQDDSTQTMLKIAKGEMKKNEIAAWLESNSRERPRIELRDFFSAISEEQFLAAFNLLSPDAPGSGQESVVVTLDECRDAISFTELLANLLVHATETGNEADRLNALISLKTIGALYRIAEDMGYEW